MIKKYSVIGAIIGGSVSFAYHLAVIIMVAQIGPGRPGMIELAFQFVLICIFVAVGAVIGLGVGFVVSIAVSAFSKDRDKE